MIKELLNATFLFEPKRASPFPIDLKLNAEYMIKCNNLSGTQHSFIIEIYNLPFPETDSNIQENIFQYKFIESVSKRFRVRGVRPFEGYYCLAELFIWLDEDIEYADVLNIKLIEINSEHLESLKLNTEKMEQIINIIEILQWK